MRIENENGYIIYSIDDMDDDSYVIEEVKVKNKRTGTGTELVKKVIEIAQAQNKGLSLCAYPQDDSITLDGLKTFYEKLGFTVEYDTGEAILMKY